MLRISEDKIMATKAVNDCRKLKEVAITKTLQQSILRS